MDPALWELLRSQGDPDDRRVEAIIRVAEPELEISGVRFVSRFGAIATCRIRAVDVLAVHAREDVLSLKAARTLGSGTTPPKRRPTHPVVGPTRTDRRRAPDLLETGAGVVVASVDWGVDFDADVFRTPHPATEQAPDRGRTRFLAFWDQRDQATGHPPTPYGYGAVHHRPEIDAALRSGRPYEMLGYHPGIADRGTGAHGTHVLDIAAGNGRGGGPVGIAPEADLVFVHLADRGTGGLASLGDSVRLLEAVDFIVRTAGPRPCVINLSLGRHGGPHDGSTLVELAFDTLLEQRRGIFICESAGNYYTSRTHAAGVLGPDDSRELGIEVEPGNVTRTEVEVWYSGTDEFEVRLDPPGRRDGSTVAIEQRADLVLEGRPVGRVYHRRDPNGDNHVDAFFDAVGLSGTWTLTLTARRIRDGRFDAWIERDDVCGACQARFVPGEADRYSTVGTIATGHLPLVIGAYDGHDPGGAPAAFSSAGPTRDGRSRPDLAAPGVDVLATRSAPIGADHNAGLLVRKSGTSMATPHVAGAMALCAAIAGHRLSARILREAALASCRQPEAPDPDGRLGAGALDIPRLLAIVRGHIAALGPQSETPVTETAEALVTTKLTRWEPDAEDTVRNDPATAYRECVYRPQSAVSKAIDRRYLIVARPGRVPDRRPVAGDLLIEVTLGRLSPARCVVLDGSDLDGVRADAPLPVGTLILRPAPVAPPNAGTSAQPSPPEVGATDEARSATEQDIEWHSYIAAADSVEERAPDRRASHAGWDGEDDPVAPTLSTSFPAAARVQLPDVLQAEPIAQLSAAVPTEWVLWMIAAADTTSGVEPGWSSRLFVDLADLPKAGPTTQVHVAVVRTVPFAVNSVDLLAAFARFAALANPTPAPRFDVVTVGEYMLNRRIDELFHWPPASVATAAKLQTTLSVDEAANYKLVVYAVLPQSIGQVVAPRDVRALRGFAFDKSELTDRHERMLRSLAREIVRSWQSRSRVTRIVLQGHTDPVGTDAYNDDLGRRRATAVADRLKALINDSAGRLPVGTVESIHYDVESYGKRRPYSRLIQALNRRVDILIYRETTPSPDPLELEPTVRRLEGLVAQATGMPADDAARLRCLLAKVRDPHSDDRFANETQVFLISRDNAMPHPTEWNRVRTQVLYRDRFGPAVSDANALANLGRIDEDIAGGVAKMNQMIAYASGAMNGLGLMALPDAFKQFNAWVLERLQDSASVYSCYPALRP